jgi:hypothetical protein
MQQWGTEGIGPEGSDLLPAPQLADRIRHLAANGLLALSQDPAGVRVSYGSRTRALAKKWGIVLREDDEGQAAATA